MPRPMTAGTTLARHDDALRIRLAQHRERVGALQLGNGLAYRLEQIGDEAR